MIVLSKDAYGVVIQQTNNPNGPNGSGGMRVGCSSAWISLNGGLDWFDTNERSNIKLKAIIESKTIKELYKLYFKSFCKDCGAETKLGSGSARCPSCWDDRCGGGE